jgi:hypothetical protein
MRRGVGRAEQRLDSRSAAQFYFSPYKRKASSAAAAAAAAAAATHCLVIEAVSNFIRVVLTPLKVGVLEARLEARFACQTRRGAREKVLSSCRCAAHYV